MEQLYFIGAYSISIIGMSIFAYAMGYYTLKSKLEAERTERIQQQEQIGKLHGELDATQAALQEKKNEVNDLEENLKAERTKRIQQQTRIGQLHGELTETQNQLHQQIDEVNEERTERIRHETEVGRLQQKLSSTQSQLHEQENKVSRLEGNLEAEKDRRTQHQREIGRLQGELTTTQNQLHQQIDEVNEERTERIRHETEVGRLQQKLSSTQSQLHEQENKVSRLEGNLEAEKGESEQLQGELAAIQEALDELKDAIARLEKETKEKSDNQGSEEQSETEENHTDTDQCRNQGDKAPRKIKGRREPVDEEGAPGGNGDRRTDLNLKPELVCRKNGRQWEILVVPPEGQPPVQAQQNGEALSPRSNGEYPLNDFSENLTVVYAEAAEPEMVELCNSNSPLIFKLRRNWQGEGRKVRRISRGYFIVFAPRDWQRTGTPPIASEPCSDTEFLAHHFYADNSDTTDGFEERELPSSGKAFSLEGNEIYDDSDQGLLFIGDPPALNPTENVSWVRIGEEGGGGWKGKNFKPNEITVSTVLSGRQGWFYVRVYDEAVQLIDSNHFRYSQTLKEIRVDDDIYSEEMLLVPSDDGYTDITIRFIDKEGNNIHPENIGNNSHASIRNDDAVIVAPHPEGDLTRWKVDGIDAVITLPRVWWQIRGADDSSDEWHSKPIPMSREEFCENEDAIVHISLPTHFQKIQVGFGSDSDRPYNAIPNNENENRHIFEVPIRDFVDYQEIEEPSLEDTHLNIQCNRQELPIIRVPAEVPSLKEIQVQVNGTTYSYETLDNMLLVPSTDGYTETTIQFIDAAGNNICPENIGNNSHTSIRNDDAVIVAPHPDGDLTEWKVDGVDTVIALPRVWWCITETEEFLDAWRDKPIVMSCKEFLDNTDAVVQVSLPASVEEIQARLGLGSWSPYSGTTNGENEKKRIFKLRIRDFDHQEINKLFPERTHLEIQCNGKQVPIVHVPGQKECPKCGSGLTTIIRDRGKLRQYQCKKTPSHWETLELPLTAEQR